LVDRLISEEVENIVKSYLEMRSSWTDSTRAWLI